jgi:hypothetical protein
MAGKKTFVAGEVLTAQDVNDYLMDQSVMTFASDAARSSAIPTPTQGMISYQTDTDAIEAYDGSNWVTRVSTSVPFAMAAGTITFTGSATITFPVGRFTVGPIITGNGISASNVVTSVTFSTPNSASVTAYAWTGDTASTTSRAMHYHAIQMTSAAAAG